MAQASFEPGTSRSRVLRSAAAPRWLGIYLYLLIVIIIDKAIHVSLEMRDALDQVVLELGLNLQQVVLHLMNLMKRNEECVNSA